MAATSASIFFARLAFGKPAFDGIDRGRRACYEAALTRALHRRISAMRRGAPLFPSRVLEPDEMLISGSRGRP